MNITELNKYSDKKIVWFPEKLKSYTENRITSPIYVRIKPLNRCNHKCFWCVYHEPEMSGMHQDMIKSDKISIEKMREILLDLKDMGVKAVTYSGGGEPLMHSNIVEILSLTKNYQIDLSVITNGQFLKGEVANCLKDSSWVRVSMDYATEEEFSRSRRINGKFFYEILDNIKAFSSLKEKSCDLEVNFIVTKNNYRDIPLATELLKSLGVENIRFSPMWIDSTFVEYHSSIKDEVISTIEEVKKTFQDDSFKVYTSYKDSIFTPNIYKRPYKKCYVMQNNPVIGADLNIYACHNRAYSSDSVISSIKNQSFKDAWFSETAKKFHEQFNCQNVCTTQCAGDSKNMFINDIMEISRDNFV